MNYVTRITQAGSTTRLKRKDLEELSMSLGKIRALIWRNCGSINGVYKSAYDIQNEVRPLFKHLCIASHIVSGTILDTAACIKATREAAKAEVVRAIFRHTKDEIERKRLCTALKVDKTTETHKSWTEDRYLRRQMRKYCKHGVSKCINQIVVPADCYKWYELNGRGFIKVAGFTSKKRADLKRGAIRWIAIPLTTNRKIDGAIRLIVKDSGVEIHYSIEAVDERSCGTKVIGIDKGYTEVFVDSDNDSYGIGLGALLGAESDTGKRKGQALGKLRAIAEKSEPKKRARIETNNLGKKKFLKRKSRHQKIVSTLIHNAVHSVVSKAKTIAVEDLKKPFTSKDLGVNMNRSRRGASVKLVNAAYTSQICPDCLCFGRRDHDKFHCAVCRDVKRSDHVAARNTLARLDDPEIKLYTPYREVKAILFRRSLPRLRLSNQDSSCVGIKAACAATASTESEVSIVNHGRPW